MQATETADRASERPPAACDIVLLSGGIDSATALAIAFAPQRRITGLFVDYGQPAATSERRASAAVAKHFKILHDTITVRPCTFGAGEIRGRNAFLIDLALMMSGGYSGTIIIGIHKGTLYRDCDPEFARIAQLSLDYQTAGLVALATPLVELTKFEVVQLARRLNVPLDLTYSCEAANDPCGQCLSCRDSESFLARS